MNPLRPLAILAVATTVVAACAGDSSHADEFVPTSAQLEFFEREVRPLLADHCYACHSADASKLQAGLLVDSRDALLRGGDSGEALIPGDPDASLLIEAVRYESYEMPPKGKLSSKSIEVLEQWVEMGAPWPAEAAKSTHENRPGFDLYKRKGEHWAWQPIQDPVVPEVADTAWPKDDLDHFVLARLEEKKLRPAVDADRSALLRRLYFDLIGLPPTAEQAADFLRDPSPLATERLVDELLDSPHFGERWGRHWLDLVRYAESRGHEFDNDSTNAFQYRDYVIRALNADVPYDQLVREHIAGDLLDEPRLDPEHRFNESVLGTGFWFLGEWVHSPVDIRKDETDRFDNMIDVMSKTFLGVTVSCARCHDHKFDAISTADYYSLSGFLQSSDFRQVRFESLEHNRRIADQLAAVDAKYRKRILKKLSKANVRLPEPKPMGQDLAAFVVTDVATLLPEEYMQNGFIFGSAPRHLGDPYLSTGDSEPAIRFATCSSAASDPFWNGLESTNEKGIQTRSKLAEIPRGGRTLRLPTFTLTEPRVACRVHGSGHVVACVDSHRLIAGPLHGETIHKIEQGQEWVELNLKRYVGHRVHLEFTPAENAQLEVSLVTQGASREILAQFSQREKRIAESAEAFAEDALRVIEKDSESTHWGALREVARTWADERSKLQDQIMLRSQLAMAMMDGTGEDDHLLIRGSSSNPGDVEPRHFLTALTGDQPLNIESGSGRLELARQINDPGNPLAARVIVNRIWHYLLGRGIVPTTDDFGVLGQRPTHPLLLDHLATRFMEDGRSIKQMIRHMVLSRTYQMSSQADPAAVAADPKNLLWHHRSPKRLEGEVIRDALLACSDELDDAMYGESVPIHLTDFMDGRGRPKASGPLDGDRRRSIYIAVRRNFLSPFMLTFDTPVPFSTMGRRNVSNVPAQALILMNDPLVADLTQRWAARAAEEAPSGSGQRVSWMYLTAFARLPTTGELDAVTAYISHEANSRKLEQDDIAIWADLAHALVNTKEFIFLR